MAELGTINARMIAPIEVRVTTEDCDLVLEMADRIIEYWCVGVEQCKVDGMIHLKFHTVDDRHAILSYGDLKRGFLLAINAGVKIVSVDGMSAFDICNLTYRGSIVQSRITYDIADIILQYALFGEVVYCGHNQLDG